MLRGEQDRSQGAHQVQLVTRYFVGLQVPVVLVCAAISWLIKWCG